jgi:GAF domain-containing protein
MANSGIEDFHEALATAGKRALLRCLVELCTAIGAAESSVLRPMSEAELGFFVSTNQGLTGPSVPKVPIGASFAGIVFRTGQMLAMADAVRQPGHFGGVDAVVGRATREYAALPIALGTAMLGVLTVVNRAAAGAQQVRPFTVEELKQAQRTAIALAGPLAILDQLDGSPLQSHRDSPREAFGEDFVGDLLALNETGRRVVRGLVAALPHELRDGVS